jgi:poly(3-hydroxybutyrate) depolymerase
MQLLTTFATLALATLGNCQSTTKVIAFKDGPTNLGMYVYVPKKLTAPAPIIVAIHHCQGSAQAYSTESHYMPLADQHGFILIYPNSRSSGGCFDVASTASTSLPLSTAYHHILYRNGQLANGFTQH